MDSVLLLTSVCAIGLATSYFIGRTLRGSRAPLPPGPKGYPILGNINDVPKAGEFEAHHWLKHKELYGPLSSITLLGQPIIIINDARLAVELLDKRSTRHSSRPKMIFAGEMIGWDNAIGFLEYNDRFRTSRKRVSRIMGSKVRASQFNKLQEAEAGHFLLRVLENPGQFLSHIRKEAGSVILRIIYGYSTERHENDPLVDLAEEAMDNFGRAAVPGAFIVDMIPFLKNIPDWVPGTGFKKIARQYKEQLKETRNKPYDFVQHSMAQGKYESSFLSHLIEAGDSTPEENKWAAVALYAAGADTTVSSIACFFLAMTIHPEVQRRAQEEIDQVVGQDRLPTTEDRDNLPYVNAVVKEVLRWKPVAPMGLPHSSTEDDICEGYLIPKGSILLPNIWQFSQDPSAYPDPTAFKPERFLATDDHKPEMDPNSYVFGFGRRICPGRLLAGSALFLNVAQALAVFKISKPLANGQEVEPVVQFRPGIVTHPTPFQSVIQPRSPHHEELIKSVEKMHPWKEGDSKILNRMDYKE